MYMPILGTLGYILSPSGDETLLVHRTARASDQHLGKYNGLGGKMKANEDVFTCMQREILEESGLVCRNMYLRGTINWTGFGPEGEDWLGFIFLITSYTGVPFASNAEGRLLWHPVEGLLDLPMWEGDRFFFPWSLTKTPDLFMGTCLIKTANPFPGATSVDVGLEGR